MSTIGSQGLVDLPPAVHAVTPATKAWPLHGVAASRQLELNAAQSLPPHTLMQRAGFASARLALAIAPHAQRIVVLAGPGNNGGDGLIAARFLHQWGKSVQVHRFPSAAAAPADAAWALQQAIEAGVLITESGDAATMLDAGCELVIDALLGLGARRAPADALEQAIAHINHCATPVLALDLPSGLNADTGQRLGEQAVRAAHTLSLLALKPGLFTAHGRDHAGRIWHSDLGVDNAADAPTAWLAGPPRIGAAWSARLHVQHKGSFGDVIVIGGASGLEGAVDLAARAALAAGAGRVFVGSLGAALIGERARPELMQRRIADLLLPATLAAATVVCGCGGGQAVREPLPTLLHHAARLVLDADALNAVAADPALAQALTARQARGLPTVLTPHPLEAARLLGLQTSQVQADRLVAALDLAQRTRACVVLKGSGSVIASLDAAPVINPTGNARLASAGTGDVLAGWIGGLWAQLSADDAALAAEAAVWLHGRAAENGNPRLAARALDLIEAMRQALPSAA